MDFKTEALREHSKTQCHRIVNYVGSDRQRFSALIDAFLAGPYRVTQRLAWPLSYCVESNKEIITPYLGKILTLVQQPETHNAVKRNVLRMLQFIDIPIKQQGTVADLCFRFFTDMREPIAVRVFSMTVLANLAKKLPELKNEILPIIEDQLPYASAGFISRGKKILNELKS
ncbi:MAG: hypothetical protein JST48_15415 [Bacteroidetes bacterium]|nr:hypothetical protein [Bacteroidota bacterium]